MRIDRVEASRHKKDRVLVFLEDGACLKITQQELLDFGLRSGDELDEASLRKLKEAAGVSNTRAAAADLIGKRAMSRRDLERKLRDKGASEAEARYAAEWLEAIGAINGTVLIWDTVPSGCGRSSMKRAFPGNCGTTPWIRCRTPPGRSTAFYRPSSGEECRMRGRKSAFAMPWPAGALPGRISGQD